MHESLSLLTERLAVELTSESEATASLDLADAADLPPAEAVEAALPEKGITVGLHRLLARAREAAGEVEEADRLGFQIVERLNQAGYWRPLARLLDGMVERHAQQAAPLVLRARLNGGPGAVSDDLLFRAHDLLPHHGHLAWAAAQLHAARGETAEARRAARLALPELLDDRSYDEADEALLLAVESEDEAAARSTLRALDILARQGEWKRFATVLEVAADLLAAPAAVDTAWPHVQELWLKHPAPEALRAGVVRLAEAYLARYPEPATLLRVARLAVPAEDPAGCLERLRKASEFPPGWYAAHAAWGIGRIRDNDTEALVVDFPAKPLHRMTVATAERALESLDPDDLRVLEAHRPDELARLVREEPARVVERALRRFPDGEATVDKLRKILVPSVVPSTGWAGWWKGARTAIGGDPRIDSRRAYENVYRIRRAGEGVEEIELPVWNDRIDVMKNVSVLDTFLGQHPDAGAQLLEEFEPRLAGIAGGAKHPMAERISAALWLVRAGAPVAFDFEAGVVAGFDANALGKDDQELLLTRLSGPAALAAMLDSRLAGIRREAWAALRARGVGEAAARDALRDASNHAEAALHLLTEAAPADELPVDAEWTGLVLLALTDVLENGPRDTHRKRALALLGEDSPLASRLLAAPADETAEVRILTRLKAWRASDRYRFPLLDFLRTAGHATIAEEVEGHRARSAAKLARRATVSDDPYEGDLVLTRPTLHRLEEERVRIGMELKTTIPATIQRARELGDLRENAEYAAAKAKQIEYAKRFTELEGLLKRIRIIEELAREPGVALPGTEVRIEAADGGPPPSPDRLWLLGEGDQTLGEAIVSYRAPVGKAIHGKRVGDEVVIPAPGSERRYRIVEVRERLPEA